MTEQAAEARVDVTLTEHPRGGVVAHVVMDHRRRLNAANHRLIESLRSTFETLADNRDLRAATLTGAGDKAFMGGADINELAELNSRTGRQFITGLHRANQAIRKLPVPVIARLRGYCLGAGTEVAAACDFRVADESFVVGMPEVKVGLPSVIEAALFPQLIGWGKTREMVLTGKMYDAEEALRMGFVENLVPAAELDGTVAEFIDHICQSGPHAVRAQKALVTAWEKSSVEEAIDIGIDCFEAAFETDEPSRMTRAFLKK